MAFADVEDLDKTRESLLSAGATERDAPRRAAPEARVCVLLDADGNPIGLRGKVADPWAVPPPKYVRRLRRSVDDPKTRNADLGHPRTAPTKGECDAQ